MGNVTTFKAHGIAGTVDRRSGKYCFRLEILSKRGKPRSIRGTDLFTRPEDALRAGEKRAGELAAEIAKKKAAAAERGRA